MARRVGLAALLILSLEALVPRPRAPQTRRLRSAAEPWYAEEGLKFDCTGCGDCCRVEGDVWLNGQEAAGMAKLLGVEEREYDVGYTDVALEGGWRRLIASEKRCIFLDDEERCSVHAARPLQCRAYPFWPRILQSREAWDAEKGRCEGIESAESTEKPVALEAISREVDEWSAWLRRFPRNSAAAVDDTAAWAQTVVDLELCPWAKKSLEAGGACRYTVTLTTDAQEFAKCVVDAAADVFESPHDDAAAIVFVVAPNFLAEDFEAFYAFCEDLEDDVFTSLPAPLNSTSASLADDIQVAGFHPRWLFAGLAEESPVHFEKRSPFSTVSVVRRKALEKVQSAAVAEHNEQILEKLGTEQVRKRFENFLPRDPAT